MQHEAITPYPEVNMTLHDLLRRVESTLGDQLFGLYLYGSLVTGDFDSERSDIDFVVVTDDDLPDSLVTELQLMHMSLATKDLPWAKKLEGNYIPLRALRVYIPDDPPRPTVNEGRFYLARHGNDWVIQRKVLRENHLAVAGPSLRSYIDPVPASDQRRAIRQILREWWVPMLADPARLRNPEYQAYAVLSICRAIYTLECDELVSKTAAGRWAIANVGSRWGELISDALAWRHGDPPGSVEDTLEFIGFGVTRSEDPGRRGAYSA